MWLDAALSGAAGMAPFGALMAYRLLRLWTPGDDEPGSIRGLAVVAAAIAVTPMIFGACVAVGLRAAWGV